MCRTTLGNSWEVLPLPSGLTAATNLTCPSAQTCVGGGVLMAGRYSFPLWTAATSGASPRCASRRELTLVDLVCPWKSCNGITVPSTPPGPARMQPTTARQQIDLLSEITIAGANWTAAPVSEGDQCRGHGRPDPSIGLPSVYPVGVLNRGLNRFGLCLLDSPDGGKSWNTGTLPEGFGFLSANGGISCADSAHCMAIGQISVPNPERCIGPNFNLPPGASSCSTGSTIIVTGVATTADDGATWQLRPLPSDVPQPQMSDVSCASATICWLAGEEAVPQQNGTGGTNGGSAVLLGTSDGGATWTRETFTIPAVAPEDVGQDSYMTVGQISCPTTSTCVGLGLSDRGSPTTPVYSYKARNGIPKWGCASPLPGSVRRSLMAKPECRVHAAASAGGSFGARFQTIPSMSLCAIRGPMGEGAAPSAASALGVTEGAQNTAPERRPSPSWPQRRTARTCALALRKRTGRWAVRRAAPSWPGSPFEVNRQRGRSARSVANL